MPRLPWSLPPTRTPRDDASRRRPDARALLEEAEADAAQILERADRRSAESEAGAQQLRRPRRGRGGRPTRTEAADELRVSREEAAQILSEAQADADQRAVRPATCCPTPVPRSPRCRHRRDEIAAELTQLSGVIEALAVSESDPEEQP